MKKLVLLFVSALVLVSCDIDDDGPNISYQLAEITNADLPEFFEEGESYEIDVIYELPTACHTPFGLDPKRGGNQGDERRDIYVGAITSYNADLGECNEDDDDLEVEDSFTIPIDEEEPYTFYFWTGQDSTGEPEYMVIEVPVGAPDDDGEGDNGDDDGNNA